MPRVTITLYTSTGCPGCPAARQWLADRNVTYVEQDLTDDDIGRQEMWQAMQRIALPCLRIDDRWVGGFSYGTWHYALREAETDE